MSDNGDNCIYVLKHYDTESNIENVKIFTCVDAAIEVMRQWFTSDNDITNYTLSKHVLDGFGEYIYDSDYDFDDLVDDMNDDDISLIDSDEVEDM